MGSGLNFRSRPLDIGRLIPIYEDSELPDLYDSCMVNRTVTKVPTGMEKEEETEHDLQKALIAQKTQHMSSKALIPTPEVILSEVHYYSPRKVVIPQSLVAEELVPQIDSNVPAYDMDMEDEHFLYDYNCNVGVYHDAPSLEADEFETMMETLENFYKREKDLEKGVHLVNTNQVNKYVFRHWKEKRQRMNPSHMIIPTVRTVDRGVQQDPFVAFRKRIEKMQTRKNRKLDENRYTKAVRFASSLLSLKEMLNAAYDREKLKLKLEQLNLDLFYERCKSFFNGDIDSMKQSEDWHPPLREFNALKSAAPTKKPVKSIGRRYTFWRDAWRSLQPTQNEEADKNETLEIEYFTNNGPKFPYAVKRPPPAPSPWPLALPRKRFKANFLTPIRTLPPLQPQDFCEVVRKLYYAKRVIEHSFELNSKYSQEDQIPTTDMEESTLLCKYSPTKLKIEHKNQASYPINKFSENLPKMKSNAKNGIVRDVSNETLQARKEAAEESSQQAYLTNQMSVSTSSDPLEVTTSVARKRTKNAGADNGLLMGPSTTEQPSSGEHPQTTIIHLKKVSKDASLAGISSKIQKLFSSKKQPLTRSRDSKGLSLSRAISITSFEPRSNDDAQ